MKNFQTATAAKVVLGMLMGTLALTTAANAQPAFSGTFVLPQQVRWSQAVLPAGEYTIEVNSIREPAVLHSKTTNQTYYTAMPIILDSEAGGTQLDITVRGNDRVVRALNIPDMGHALVFGTLTNAQKESLTGGNKNESVPLFAARK